MKSPAQSRWDCKRHVVVIPKYRRKVIYGELRDFLGKVFLELARQKECLIIEGHLPSDHVHMCQEIPPKHAVAVCCSPRPDVAAAFPSDVNALLSGSGFISNWRSLTAGEHTAQIQFESTTGETLSSGTRTLTVVKPGGFTFPSALSLTGARASLEGKEVVLSGVTVTEARTGNTARVNLACVGTSGPTRCAT